MDKKANFNAWYVVVAVLGMLLLQAIFQQAQQTEPLPYSHFRQYLEQGKIDDLLITETRITGKFKSPGEGEPSGFVTTRIDPGFAQELEKHGVTFRGGSDQNFFTTLLSWVLPALIFFGIWIFLLRRMAAGGMGAGGLMSIGKSRAKIYVEKDTKTTLADVAGVDEAKAEVQEIIDFLKDPKGYGVLGARLPRESAALLPSHALQPQPMNDVSAPLALSHMPVTLMANAIRALAMDAVQQANSGHPGTPMALAPVVY